MPAQCTNARQCSSEQGLWTPAALRPAIWVKSNSAKNIIVSSGDGDVKSVTDLSSGVPFSVTGSVKLNTSQLNGKPTLRIDNTSTAQLLTASYSYAGNEITLISLHRNAATASGRTVYGRLFSLYRGPNDYAGTDGGILTYGVGGVNGVRFYRNTGINVTSSPTINDVWGCAVLTRSGTGVTMALDGGSRVSGTTASNNFNFDKVRIGNDDGPREDSGMNGYIAENILITRAITQEEENKLFGYLAWEWGRVTSLPIDHPYRFAPPRDNRILTRKRRSFLFMAAGAGTGGGGTTYNVTLSESVTSAASMLSLCTWASSLLESITPADALACAVTFTAARTETTTVAESLTAAATFSATISAAATPADAMACVVTFNASRTETTAPSDAMACVVTFNAVCTETATTGAALTAAGTFAATLGEGIAPADAVSGVLIYSVTLGELVTPADALSGAMAAYQFGASRLVLDEDVRMCLLDSDVRTFLLE